MEWVWYGWVASSIPQAGMVAVCTCHFRAGYRARALEKGRHASLPSLGTLQCLTWRAVLTQGQSGGGGGGAAAAAPLRGVQAAVKVGEAQNIWCTVLRSGRTSWRSTSTTHRHRDSWSVQQPETMDQRTPTWRFTPAALGRSIAPTRLPHREWPHVHATT